MALPTSRAPHQLIPMTLEIIFRERLRFLVLVLMLAMLPAFGADAPALKTDSSSDKDAIVSTTAMQLEAEGTDVHGQLVVVAEILSTNTQADLIYTITTEPQHGRVGLAGA